MNIYKMQWQIQFKYNVEYESGGEYFKEYYTRK